jgi:uncharacterized protein YdhG (YjbR/CyaY superfamily)
MKRKVSPRKSVDAYIADQTKEARRSLALVRRTVRAALPDAEETISYRLPAFRLHGRIVLYFAAWAGHYALYPANTEVVAALQGALAPYEVAKGTIRFPYTEPVPTQLITRIAKFRARQIAAKKKSTRMRTIVSRPSAARKDRQTRRRPAR